MRASEPKPPRQALPKLHTNCRGCVCCAALARSTPSLSLSGKQHLVMSASSACLRTGVTQGKCTHGMEGAVSSLGLLPTLQWLSQ